MLSTLFSLKGIGIECISYEELQNPVLIFWYLPQEGRKDFPGAGGPRDYYRKKKKKKKPPTNRICLFNSCLIRHKTFSTTWVHLRDMQAPLHCIPLYYSGLSFPSSYRNPFCNVLKNKWYIWRLLFSLVWLNLESQESLGNINYSKPKTGYDFTTFLP